MATSEMWILPYAHKTDNAKLNFPNTSGQQRLQLSSLISSYLIFSIEKSTRLIQAQPKQQLERSRTMFYDVECTMPAPATDPEAILAVRSANLMCYLLGDVTYDELYRKSFADALDQIIIRAEKIVQKPRNHKLKHGAYNSPDISIILRDGLVDLRRNVLGAGDIVLGNLFIKHYPDPASLEYRVTARLYKLYCDSLDGGYVELSHLCCPFLNFQISGGTQVDTTDYLTYMRELGDKTLYDIFAERRARFSSTQIQAVQDAKRIGILSDKTPRPQVCVLDMHPSNPETRPEPFEPYTGGTGNRLRCQGGVCVTGAILDWCNDANGSCSAASNP